jgi:Protein of unknown function (DUF2818)
MTGMVPSWAIAVVLVAALIGANLPFVNDRLFLVGPKREPKSAVWRVLELLAYALIVGLIGRGLESSIGQALPVRWEFVAVWLLVFLTLAFPGFVWRYLRKQ